MAAADLLRAIALRWRLVLLVTLLVAAAAVAMSAAAPRTAIATTTLMIDRPAEIDPTAARDAPSVDMDQVLGEQADLLRSERVVGMAANDPALAADAGLRVRWQKATRGQAPFRSWAAQTIAAQLTVDHEHGSNLLTVSMADRDPAVAASLANAVARAYLATQLRLASDPARTYAAWYRARIGEARATLEQAQTRLVSFQRSHDLLGAQPADAQGDRLQGLMQQLALAYGVRAEHNAQAASDPGAAAGTQTNKAAQDLRAAVAEQTARVAELGKRLGPLHPDMIAGTAMLTRLRDELAATRAEVARSQVIESAGANRRVAALERVVDAERGRILAAQANRAELDLLQRDVQSASASYDAVQTRLMAMRLRAEAPRTNVRQLDMATVPKGAGRAQLALRAVLGLVLGIALGVTIAAGLEWRDPRVRTSATLAAATAAPVLATLPLSGYLAATNRYRRAA